jgi:hypothetical protein
LIVPEVPAWIIFSPDFFYHRSLIIGKKKTRLDVGFVEFLKTLTDQPPPLANPGIFLFLSLLYRLKIFKFRGRQFRERGRNLGEFNGVSLVI